MAVSDRNFIKYTSGIDQQQVDSAFKSINPKRNPESTAFILAKKIINGYAEDWWEYSMPEKMYEMGIYSPLQLLIHFCSSIADINPDHDYPFLFGTIGALISLLTAKIDDPEDADKLDRGRENFKARAEDYRKILQTIFQMREIREEGENLSIETHIPSSIDDTLKYTPTSLKVKKLGQIFGRGVGTVSAHRFAERVDVEGGVYNIFQDHQKAPSTLLYTLGKSYSHIPSDNISVALHRDRSVIVSAKYNPLLEFYDGGWHISDISSAKDLVNHCLKTHTKLRLLDGNPNVSEKVLSLAYYMASHWHSGILAIINCDCAESDGILERQKKWSENSTAIMKEILGAGTQTDLYITNIRPKEEEDDKDANGFGRVLLTNAIQDGATLFYPDGKFHSAGRVVTKFKDLALADPNLGTGNRAAMKLSEYGVVLKVSEDGAIRLYSGDSNGNKLLTEGFRIR